MVCGRTLQFWSWQRCGCWTQIELEFGNIDVQVGKKEEPKDT